eukprot:358615-Chlamydomonas_euryale.AAC.4
MWLSRWPGVTQQVLCCTTRLRVLLPAALRSRLGVDCLKLVLKRAHFEQALIQLQSDSVDVVAHQLHGKGGAL